MDMHRTIQQLGLVLGPRAPFPNPRFCCHPHRLSDELEQLCGEPPAAGPGGLSQLMTAATCSMRLALPPPLIGTNLPALLQSSGLVAGLPNHNMLPQPPALQLPPLDCELLCNYDYVASSLGGLGDA